MATKLIRMYLSSHPDLEIPDPLKEKLDMKRFNKKIYGMFVDFFTSIGESDLAEDVIREAKIKIKKDIQTLPEEKREEPIEILENLVETLAEPETNGDTDTNGDAMKMEKRLAQIEESLKQEAEKIAHINSVMEFMYDKELKKTDAKTDTADLKQDLTKALATMTPAERWKLKSKLKK